MSFLEKFNPKRIKGKLADKIMERQKHKAAAAIMLSYKMGGAQIAHQLVFRRIYNVIDKTASGKIEKKDIKFWRKKICKPFERNIIGVPNEETTFLRGWLNDFADKLGQEEITDSDKEIMLTRLKPYIQSCERQQMELLVADLKLFETGAEKNE